MNCSIDDIKAVTETEDSAESFEAAPEKLVSGSGKQHLWNAFTDATGQFHAGIWHGEAGILRVRYTENELCVLLSGKIRLADMNGKAKVFEAGQSFVIPAGFEGTWETLEACRKIYAIFEQADG